MPKATLEFNLPEERVEFEQANQAGALVSFLWEVENRVFRPARKHGYPEQDIQNLIDVLNNLVEKHATEEHPKSAYDGYMNATSLIGLLEKQYFALRDECGVKELP